MADEEQINENEALEFFKNLPDEFCVLEEQVDIHVQVEYFRKSGILREQGIDTSVLNEKVNLFRSDIPVEEKKILLQKLAILENIEAYRCIEKYKSHPDPELKEWASLALLESRTVIENSLTDGNQVIVSTGLGGKGNKLRYFVVFFLKEGNAFTDIQKKIIASEIGFTAKKHQVEIEKMEAKDNVFTLICLVPVKAPLKEIFNDTVQECNQFGDFLKPQFIITNVKILSYEEIRTIEREKEGQASGTIDLNRVK
jgi:hypothetical protein